ncbi:helix-turn-helix domain-containing protein [Fictibacillus sp. JL2B1089]|uniref:helix-turn-helix domain-containing protein n=1 Tax=Fictibacillus sp. JL2B1089 TaxID=3399565 RepID=UPI003A89B79D
MVKLNERVPLERKIVLKIDQLMKRDGLTQNEVAKQAGVRQAVISEYSRNIRTQVDLYTLMKIADVFEVTDINEIVEIVDNPEYQAKEKDSQ